MAIAENLKQILKEIDDKATLVAVTKNRPLEEIKELYSAGYSIFGENRVQDLVEKFDVLPKDIQWHLIGHLQTNKVKYIAPFVQLIHSVDSLKLLLTIDKEGFKNNRVISCLLQFHVAEEETKFGLNWDEACLLLNSSEYKAMKNVQITGIMGMASNTENQEQVAKEFETLSRFFKTLKRDYFEKDANFKELSMGMSGDYQLAIQKGSTLVRVGSALFRK